MRWKSIPVQSTVRLATLSAFALSNPLSWANPPRITDPPATRAVSAATTKETSIPVAPANHNPEFVCAGGSGFQRIDLPTALRLAGANNPELLRAEQRVLESIAARQLSAAQILPTLNAGANYDQHGGNLQSANGTVFAVQRSALYVGAGASAVGAGTVNIPGVSYNLNIGDGIFVFLQSRQAVRQTQFASLATRNAIFLRVTTRYLDLLQAQTREAVLRQVRTEAAEVARLTAAYAQTGQGRQSDAERAATELAQRDFEVAQASGDVETSSARLAEVLSLDSTTQLRAAETQAVPTSVVPAPIPLQELLAVAVMQRPELEQRRAAFREAMLALSGAKLLPFSPTFILGYSAGGFGGGSDLVAAGIPQSNGSVQTAPRFGDLGGRTDFDAVAYWSLRNLGVGNLALVRGARARVRIADLQGIETFDRVRREVVEAQVRSQSRLAQIDVSEKAIQRARNAFRQDLERIRNREGLPIEVLDSLRLLGRARTDYLEAIFGYNRAQFELYWALGQPPADVLARPAPSPDDLALPAQPKGEAK